MASSILEAARAFHSAGFSLIPCKYKKPHVATWQEYTTRRPTLREIERWFEEQEAGQSMGVVLGQVSHNVVVIDLDGWDCVRLFQQHFPKLLNTYTVLTGSLGGLHLYYRPEKLPENMNVRIAGAGGIEIRGNGQYVIAPPSPHLSGFSYKVQHRVAIMRLEDMSEISAWLAAFREGEQAASQQRIVAASKAKQLDLPIESQHRKRNFLKTVLSQEIARVETAGYGARNTSLFYAGMRLANLAAGGELAWSDCETRLLAAAISVGTPEGEARRTISSAWRIGSKNPKKVN
jgi:Bifunctional DNA primase/polymerase, N-terminal